MYQKYLLIIHGCQDIAAFASGSHVYHYIWMMITKKSNKKI